MFEINNSDQDRYPKVIKKQYTQIQVELKFGLRTYI